MREEVTFSGTTAEPLNREDIRKAITLLKSNIPEPQAHHINQNVSPEKLFKLFDNQSSVETDIVNQSIYGLPMYQRKYVPLDEFWFMDKDGKVIKKFKF